MKTLKQYLPEGFADQMQPPTKSDNMGPISGEQANNQPNPANTVNGHRELNIGDPVVIVGNVEYEGKTGEVDDFGRDKHFVVVDLYKHGKHSFHESNVEYNDYDDGEDDEYSEEDEDDREMRNLRKMAGLN